MSSLLTPAPPRAHTQRIPIGGSTCMRSQPLNIKFSAELVKEMTLAAKAKYISRSAFIREAVAKKFNREHDANKTEALNWEKLLNKEN